MWLKEGVAGELRDGGTELGKNRSGQGKVERHFMVARSTPKLVREKLVKAVKTVGIKVIQETLHTMAVSDLTLADSKGNLTQNCAHQKSLQEPQLSMLLCFCTQDRVVSTVSSWG